MNCLICGNSQDFTKLFPDFTNTENYLCMKCGLVFIPRKKEQFAAYYKDDGYYKESPNIAARPFLTSRSMLISLARERIQIIKKLLQNKVNNLTVLDVGCGYGELLYVFKTEHNCKVLGIEPSKNSAYIGSKMFNIDIESILLNEYNKQEKFDLIICKHTLEHLEDPIEFLNQLKALLNDNGKLYIEVPNILHPSGGFDLKTFLYFEHLQTFSSWTLYSLLVKAGLYVESYNDSGFLEFICSKNKETLVSIPTISADTVSKFLINYKKSYNLLSFIRVYLSKFSYLIKLIGHKFKDALYGQTSL